MSESNTHKNAKKCLKELSWYPDHQKIHKLKFVELEDNVKGPYGWRTPDAIALDNNRQIIAFEVIYHHSIEKTPKYHEFNPNKIVIIDLRGYSDNLTIDDLKMIWAISLNSKNDPVFKTLKELKESKYTGLTL